MKIKREIWNQIKNVTAAELMSALEKDGWIQDITRGATMAYRHPDGRRVTIHYHPKKTYGEDTLKSLLVDIGWTYEDLLRLKLIKRIG